MLEFLPSLNTRTATCSAPKCTDVFVVMCVLFHDIQSKAKRTRNFFQGFSLFLWGAVLKTAMYGQVVSFTLFNCDNIVKVFANSATVIVSALVDCAIFGKEISLAMVLAGIIVFSSTVIFYPDHSLLLQPDTTLFGLYPCSRTDTLWTRLLLRRCRKYKAFVPSLLCATFGFYVISARMHQALELHVGENEKRSKEVTTAAHSIHPSS